MLTPSTGAGSMGAMNLSFDCAAEMPCPFCNAVECECPDEPTAYEPGPDCDVCDDTGEVPDAPGAGGRLIHPCLNCGAYDRNEQAASDAAAEMWED
jgi:hypothetical protein